VKARDRVLLQIGFHLRRTEAHHDTRFLDTRRGDGTKLKPEGRVLVVYGQQALGRARRQRQ
jgi:hypothetical protein